MTIQSLRQNSLWLLLKFHDLSVTLTVAPVVLQEAAVQQGKQ